MAWHRTRRGKSHEGHLDWLGDRFWKMRWAMRPGGFCASDRYGSVRHRSAYPATTWQGLLFRYGIIRCRIEDSCPGYFWSIPVSRKPGLLICQGRMAVGRGSIAFGTGRFFGQVPLSTVQHVAPILPNALFHWPERHRPGTAVGVTRTLDWHCVGHDIGPLRFRRHPAAVFRSGGQAFSFTSGCGPDQGAGPGCRNRDRTCPPLPDIPFGEGQ